MNMDPSGITISNSTAIESEATILDTSSDIEQGLNTVHICACDTQNNTETINSNEVEVCRSRREWEDFKDRKKFIVRVLALTAFGLGITLIIPIALLLSLDFLRFVWSWPFRLIMAGTVLILSIISGCIVCFNPKYIYRGPLAVIHYFIWVYILTVCTLFVTSAVSEMNVIIALSSTVTMVGAAALIVRFTKIDFTKYVWIIYVGTIVIVFNGIIVLVFAFIKLEEAELKDNWCLNILLSFGVAVFFFFVFIIDLQSVLGGRRVELETDMYWYGALLLYMDIIEFFLCFITRFKKSTDDS